MNASDSNVYFEPEIEEYVAYVSVGDGQYDQIVAVDNIPDYSGALFSILFALGILAGMFFGRITSWR